MVSDEESGGEKRLLHGDLVETLLEKLAAL